MKILVVDDIKEDLYMLEMLLRGYGYEVKSATDGVEALGKASQEDFDMIISDVLMPRMDGFQLCREVKKNEKLKNIAFVFYTATYTEPSDEEFALSLGAERFIIKPAEPDVFIEILREVIKSHEMGTLKAPKAPIEDETVYLKEYNERLIKKLEDKMFELERVNKGLRELEDIINHSPAVVFLWRAAEGWPVEFVSDNVQQFGYTPEDFCSGRILFTNIVHPDDFERVAAEVTRYSQEGRKDFVQEYRIITKSGEVCWLDDRTWVRRDSNGVITHYQGIVLDITERKRVEEALRESEEKYRSLTNDVLDSSTVGIFILDSDFRVVWVNQPLERYFGLRRDEVVGKDKRQLIHERIKDVFEAPESFAEKVLATYDNNTYIENFECHALPDGEREERWLEHWSRPIQSGLYAGGRIEHYYDITEHKRAEEEKENIQAQLLQAQKMEAIGTLAGGVAHDFNNLLTAIQGYTEFAMMRLNEDEPVYRDLREVQRASVRAANLTRQLLLFSRRQPMEITPLNLSKTVEDMMKMVRRLIGEDITITTNIEEGLWTIKADPGNIEQVIMNLMVNARDAMPEGGEIVIRTENVRLDEDDCKAIIDARPGNFVCLSIADTGLGMDKETIERIFEPFFSTKGPGRGTGLGLSVVYGIIKQHEGWINVYSEPRQGTTFRIYLPAVPIKSYTVDEQRVSLVEFQGRGERILLVEDDGAIRELSARILRENGYVPFSAANAGEALEMFERENGDFALVFSDIVLPDKGGLQLVGELLSHKPDLRVLLSSGYSDEKSQWQAIRERGFRFLQKPYSLPDFLRTIREVLETE